MEVSSSEFSIVYHWLSAFLCLLILISLNFVPAITSCYSYVTLVVALYLLFSYILIFHEYKQTNKQIEGGGERQSYLLELC